MAKTVLITGATGGIGRATAELFARQGDRVVLGYYENEQKATVLQETIAVRGGAAITAQGDVRRAADVERMFRQAEEAFGPVEVLVNAAGIARQKLFADLQEEEWDDMFAIHAKGSFLCCRQAVKSMLRKKEGCIVNVSSMWGQVGASCEVHYSAAKAAVIGLTRALAKEMGPSGIRVNCVAPGAVDTAMLSGFSRAELKAFSEDTPLCRLGKPEEIASAIVYLASPGAAFIIGQVLAPNGGYVV